MYGHQGNLVVDILAVLSFSRVSRAQQGDILKVVSQGHHRQISRRKFNTLLHVAVNLHLFEVLAVPFLHESLHSVEKFLDIRSLGLAFNTGVLLIHYIYTSVSRQRNRHGMGILVHYP